MWDFIIALLLGLAQEDLENLRSHDYRVRQTAHRELVKNMSPYLYLQLKAAKHKDLEARQRVATILEGYEQQRISFTAYQQIKGKKEFARLQENYHACMQTHWMVRPKNYPVYPWITPMPASYRWNGWDGFQIQNFYLGKARRVIGQGRSPSYDDYRLASYLWTCDRISQGAGHGLSEKTEKEFITIMEKLTAEIHRDLDFMIQQEDAWWLGSDKNPIRSDKTGKK